MCSTAEPGVCARPAPLELDHIFCIVEDLPQVSRRLQRSGWVLDAGTAHEGQGVRNRRMAWPEQHLELLCVVDPRVRGVHTERSRGDY